MQIIPMSAKEVRSLRVVEQVRAGRLTAIEAATHMEVTDRTIRRWKAAVAHAGAQGLVHGSRGKRSPRRVPQKEQDQIVSLIRAHYGDFTPAFASEKLSEIHHIDRHRTTIRTLMVKEGLWIPKSRRKGSRPVVHRAWRERKAHRGELVQFDGSYHDWFEGRGGIEEACLLAAIDDATGEVMRLSFTPHEGTLPVMAFWTHYALKNGFPASIYLDRFSTYKMTQRVAIENHDLKTQLQRAMETLGVKLIFALSPQAKGRVERLFQTLQDRLVKELRLKGLSSVEDANRFIEETFLPKFNAKFRVEPREAADFHRLLGEREKRELPETLCRVEKRSVQHDFTVSFKGQWYQLLPTAGLAIRPKDIVLVREYPDHTLSFSIRGKKARVTAIAKRQERRVSALHPIPTLVPA